MKNKLIDILAENIAELSKEDIEELLSMIKN